MTTRDYSTRDKQYIENFEETTNAEYAAAYQAELDRLLDHVRDTRALAGKYGNGDAELLEGVFHVVRRLYGRMITMSDQQDRGKL
jgi:hypothetical protein